MTKVEGSSANPAGANRSRSGANPYTVNQRQNVNPYAASQRQNQANAVRGMGFNYATKPLEEFEMERY